MDMPDAFPGCFFYHTALTKPEHSLLRTQLLIRRPLWNSHALTLKEY